MPSSFTPLLRLTLPADGELVGTWGQTVNTGITSLEEGAIAGTATIAMPDANYTLSVVNGAADEARQMFIQLNGALTATRNVVCPSVSKLYFVHNNTNQSIVFKTLAGVGVTVPSAARMALRCNGTDVVAAIDTVSSGPLAIPPGTAAAPGLFFVGDPNTGLFSPGADLVALTTGGVERLRINAVGRVGLSVDPTTLLDVNGNITLRGSSFAAHATSHAYTIGVDPTLTNGAALILYGSTAAGNPNNLLIYTSNVERMRIDAAGNVLVGTPTAHFATGGRGLLNIGGSTSAVLGFVVADAASGFILHDGADISFCNNAAGFARFLTSGTERMRIDAAGNVGVGVIPLKTLHIKGPTTTELRVETAGAVAAGGAAFVGFNDNAGSQAGYVGFGGNSNALDLYNVRSGPLTFYTNNAERARIDAEGRLLVGTTSAFLPSAGEGNFSLNGASAARLVLGIAGAPRGWLVTNGSLFGMVAGGTDPLAFFTNGTERMRIDAAGLVNITAGPGSLRIAGHITRFESAEQACPTATATLAAVHGGSRTPDMFAVVYRCKIAEGGWSPGHELAVVYSDASDSTRSTQIVANDATVTYVFAGGGPPNMRDTASLPFTLTPANWRVVFRALWL